MVATKILNLIKFYQTNGNCKHNFSFYECTLSRNPYPYPDIIVRFVDCYANQHSTVYLLHFFFHQMNIFHLRCAHIKCTWNKWLMRVHGFRTFSASFTHYFETNGILELYALNHWTMHMLISNNIVCCPTEFKIFQNPIASKCHFHLIFIIHWPFNMHICMCMLNCA